MPLGHPQVGSSMGPAPVRGGARRPPTQLLGSWPLRPCCARLPVPPAQPAPLLLAVPPTPPWARQVGPPPHQRTSCACSEGDQFSLCPDPRPPPGQARGAGLGTAQPDHWRSVCCEPDPALGVSGSLPEQVPTRGPSTWPWAWTGWAPSWLVLCGTNGALGGLVPAAAGYAAGMGGFPGEPGWGGRVRGWGRGSARGEAQLLVVPEQTDAPPATRRGQLCLGVSSPSPSPMTFTCPHLLTGTFVCVTLQDGDTHFALPRVRSSWSLPIFCCRR